MPAMTKAEYQAFLEQGTRTGKAATVRKDGAPHVTPVWFVLDGDDLIFTTGEHSAKGLHLRRDPRVTLCVDEQKPLYSFVIVEGTATLSDDLDAMLPWATRIAARYMGADRADEYGRRNAVAGELLVRVTPTRIIAEKDVAG